MKSRRARIHENGGTVSNEFGGTLSNLVFEIDMGNGADHIILAAVRRRSARKPYSAVESDDRAFSLERSESRR